jgi:glycyl-tRNA synthetase
MLEMECTNLTPRVVLETSGHVEKFTDMMVKDDVTGECKRADHLLEDAIDELIDGNVRKAPPPPRLFFRGSVEAACVSHYVFSALFFPLKQPEMSQAEKDEHRLVQRQADSYSIEEMQRLFTEFNIKPKPSKPGEVVGEKYSAPFDFNLMFATKIGPEGTSIGYLRPETAQGLFVNFRRLLDFNGKKMPFAAAQIGTGFRNEIAPRGGLLRVREFCMAEIEHFVNPKEKSHPKFIDVQSKVLSLFDESTQLGTGRPLIMSIGEAVQKGIVNNETLGYFMARTQLFAERIGLDPSRLRFRQHLKTEMAHYAADCWDLEIHTNTSGWVECVGHADRSCYDLGMHGKATNSNMVASQRLEEPQVVEMITVEADKKIVGKTFKKNQKAVIAALNKLAEDSDAVAAFEKTLRTTGSAQLESFTIDASMVKFSREKKRIEEVKFLPSVVEPSFGVGRILYCLLEHSFCQPDPDDEQRVVMKFKPAVAPTKCNV